MIRKLTAALLLWMMSMTVVMAQPGLRYCLCAHEIYLGECWCSKPDSTNPAPPTCSCECGECESSQPPGSGHEACALSRGCSLDLFLLLDEFSIPSPSDLSYKSENTLKPSAQLPRASLAPSLVVRDFDHDVRGPPPPLRIGPSMPLFLRHSAFLL